MEKKECEPGKKRGRKHLSDLILMVCVLVFCFAVWKLWGMYQGYHGGEKEYEELRQYVTVRPTEDDKKSVKEG